LFVMGIGKRTTPRAFISACEIFVYTENLAPEAEPPRPRVTRQRRKSRVVEPPTPAPVPLLRKAFEMAMQDDGWASLATMGNRLRQLDPGFDPRTYGAKQLSGLIRTYSNLFESKDIQTEDGPALIYVRLKEPTLVDPSSSAVTDHGRPRDIATVPAPNPPLVY
jgi:hypothetical protein